MTHSKLSVKRKVSRKTLVLTRLWREDLLRESTFTRWFASLKKHSVKTTFFSKLFIMNGDVGYPFISGKLVSVV